MLNKLISTIITIIFIAVPHLSYARQTGEITNETHFHLDVKYSGENCKGQTWKIAPKQKKELTINKCCLKDPKLEVSVANNQNEVVTLSGRALEQNPMICTWDAVVRYSGDEKGIEVSRK